MAYKGTTRVLKPLTAGQIFDRESEVTEVLIRLFPGLQQYPEEGCPYLYEGDPIYGAFQCTDQATSYAEMIIHLNDGHGWSFTQIADWLDAEPVDFTVALPDQPIDVNDAYDKG